LVGDDCDVVGGRSFRGTWELTPPEPDWAGRRCRDQGRPPTCPTGWAGLPASGSSASRPRSGMGVGDWIAQACRSAIRIFWRAHGLGDGAGL